MSYIEDIIEQLKNAGLQDGKPPAAPTAKPLPGPPGGPPPKYGADMKLHQKDAGYAGEDKRGVEYTKLQDRVTKYKVAIGGKMTLGAAGTVLDSPSIKQQAMQKYGREIGAAAIVPDDKALQRKPGAAAKPPEPSNYGGNYVPFDGTDKMGAQYEEWFNKSLIWVCVPVDLKDARQSVFYSHVCRPHAFHHSSLGAGREVLGAGEWIVEDGKLKKISANSGHYQPSLSSLHQCVMALSAALQPDTTVFLWNTDSLEWDDVPASKFIKDPTGGNVYKSHWNAT